MCDDKQPTKTKIDRLIEALELLQKTIERINHKL